MWDDVGKSKPNSVRHWKYDLKVTPNGSYRGTIGTPGEAGYYQYDGSDRSQFVEKSSCRGSVNKLLVDTVHWTIPGVSLSWAQQSDNRIIQRLFDSARKPVVDGLLNIAESPEIPSAIRSLTTKIPLLKPMWPRMQEALRAAKSGSRNVANKYLAWSFGIAPLISDIEKIRSYMDRLKKDEERFKRGVVRRVSAVYMGSYSFHMPDDGEQSYQGFCTTYPTTRYVLTFREKNPYNTDFMRGLDFLLRRFGSAGPASFAWERIPFSFVADWFIDTSSIVDYLDGMLQSDRIDVLSCTKSNKFVCTSEVFRTATRADTNAIIYNAKQGGVTHSYYDRSVIGRTTYVAPSDRFGKKQAALAVALLRQAL
jgi:hypothetical protein